MTACVKIFGRRPVTDGATCTGAGVRKPSREETAGWNASVARQTRPDAPTLWGFERDGLNVRTAAGRLMARVGDGNAVGVAGEVAQHFFGSAEWAFTVDDHGR